MIKYKISIYIFCVLKIIKASPLELTIRSADLQPKNFNFHPYGNLYDDSLDPYHQYLLQEKARGADLDRTGPIQFPENNDIQVQSSQHLLALPVDRLGVVVENEKRRRFTQTNTFALKTAYNSLTQHAGKVLNSNQLLTQSLPSNSYHDRRNYVDDDYEDNEANDDDDPQASSSKYSKKKYRFSYAVSDRRSGDDHSHSQAQENGAVKGSYKVQLPDGRTQIVKYTADNNGYRAEVFYEKDGIITKESQTPPINSNVAVQNRAAPNNGYVGQAPYPISYFKKAVPTPEYYYNDINVSPTPQNYY